MSQLATIYQAIADRTIGFALDGEIYNVPGLALSNLPDAVDSHRFPVRLIIPTGGRGAGQTQGLRTFRQGTQGGVIVVDWTVHDMLFWRGADAGVGLADIAPVLALYMSAYLGDLGSLRTATWSVTQISFPAIGGFEWPAESGRAYEGVIAQLTIREII